METMKQQDHTSYNTQTQYLYSQANSCDLMVKWHREFRVNESVEVQRPPDDDSEETALECTNGEVVLVRDNNRIFDVALTGDNASGDFVMTSVSNQALRKRFLCGEIVECYLEQTGWTLAYVVRQLPNAVTVPELQSGSVKSASMYDLFLCAKKGGMSGSHEPFQCSVSIYSCCVFVDTDNGVGLQTMMQVRSYHIRKVLGHPSKFKNLLTSFRANLDEGDMIEVAVLEGVPSGKNFFRRAICTHVPG